MIILVPFCSWVVSFLDCLPPNVDLSKCDVWVIYIAESEIGNLDPWDAEGQGKYTILLSNMIDRINGTERESTVIKIQVYDFCIGQPWGLSISRCNRNGMKQSDVILAWPGKWKNYWIITDVSHNRITPTVYVVMKKTLLKYFICNS